MPSLLITVAVWLAGVGQPSERRMMKSLCLCVFLLVGSVSASKAQEGVANPVCEMDNAAPDFSATSAAKVTYSNYFATVDSLAQPSGTSATTFPAPSLSTALLAEPASDSPAPSPEPRFVYGGRQDYRWQLGLGFAWFRFRSRVFNANAFGVKTTVVYFLNEWLGVEGDVTAAFSPTTVAGHNVKTVVYGGGPKVAWRQNRWEPWLHAIFGGAHEQPQTAAGSRNSYSIMAGGGADYRWNPHLSFRAEADYVRTGFFNESQANFELSGGAVVHF